MNLFCLDAETYFDDQYTLKKLTTEAYIRDTRFEALGWGVRGPTGTTIWMEHAHFKHWAARQDWSDTAIIAHHAQFDGLILSHHYGIRPAFWFDTLSMARLVHGNHIGLSLASLAHFYTLKEKSVPYDLFRGRRWADLDMDTRRQLGDGCCHDVELTYRLFKELSAVFPREELSVIDATIRFFTEPTLVGDQKLFEDLRDKEFLSKNQTMYELGVGESDLQSAAKFCELLEAEGVEIAYKDGKKGPIPAIAKTDPFMQELTEHPNERVSELAEARINVRSTIDETRAGRLAQMAARGPLCVYLSYCGAHTTRWSGGDKINLQNLPRSGELRRGLAAPDGYLFASVDQSQGECRLLNWLAGQWSVLEKFRRGEDPYIGIATKCYGFEVTKAHPKERGTGKQLELSCGFGAGDLTIQKTAARGTYGPPVEITLDEARRWKTIYRDDHQQVVALWATAEIVLYELATKKTGRWWGPMRVEAGRIVLPNGAWLDYTSLERHRDEETGETYWRLKTRRGWVKMYGAKLVENVIQALSRVVTSQAMIKIRNAGYRVVGMAHDDLWMAVPKEDIAYAEQFFIETMSMSPSWAPNCPLGAECKIGDTYD